MKNISKFRGIIFLVIFLFVGPCFVSLSPIQAKSSHEKINGYILFAPMDSSATYLIDSAGTVDHTWSSDFLPGEAVKWLGDGTILRTIKTGIYGYGGAGGGVQKVLWDGSIVWDFRYDTNGDLSHHDIAPLPNGNVLMIAWETKSRIEAIYAGKNPNSFIGNIFMPDHIIEVKPTGPTSGDIVWDWNVWDHLIQDYDPSKINYGVIANHPELVDINFGNGAGPDMMHSNSIDYNPTFDQILISVNNYNEIWVIDHSTTTAEAAGHTGGKSGKGGDLLYRWGNPMAYDAGTINDKKFFGQHDATWIKAGCPGEGNILVFNNGLYDPIPPATSFSSVDEITPPANELGVYYLDPGSAYGPETLTWRYIGNPPTSFHSYLFSGAQRLKDGNTLICDGLGGRFFEITPEGATIWEYRNPFPNPSLNHVFKVVYIPQEEQPPGFPNLMCTGSLSWTNVKPGQIINGSFQLQNIGAPGSLLNWTINKSSLDWGTWSFTPEYGKNLTPEDEQVTIYVSVIAPNEKNTKFEGHLRVENKDSPEDFELISISLKTTSNVQVLVVRFPFIQQFFYNIWKWWEPFILKFFGFLNQPFEG